MINAGFNNYISLNKVLSVVDFDSKPAPIKRAIKAARDTGTIIDITKGKPTKSVVFMESGYIVLSAMRGPSLIKRIEEKKNE